MYGIISHMFYERVFLGTAILEIRLGADLSYVLRYGDLVEYTNGHRRIRGRTLPYEFRSVEQLRYDFEEDVKSAAEAA